MSSNESSNTMFGASVYARELSKRRVAMNTTIQTPSTPVTPVTPTTPMLAAHIFTDGNMIEDLQLAAELGKTLLERNKDLEGTIRDLRTVVDDKTQEIEYLSKQTAALREVNDSRLRIYEQLEVSIQDLEKSNQRLTAETGADKKKIRSLSGTVEQLEAKCEELQKCLDEARATQQQKLRDQQESSQRSGRRSFIGEENRLKRSQSCENTYQSYDDLATEGCELQARIVSLRDKLKVSQQERQKEARRREELEIEIACLIQENSAIQEQMMVFKEKGTNFKSFDDELASLDDTTSGKFCRKCMGGLDETGSNLTVQDFVDDIEDMEPSFDIQGGCAFVRLKNGGYAWGSQESLASMGQIVNCTGSNSSSPRTEASEAPHNSLLSELDTQYRILIEKYEALVEARERTEEQTSKKARMDSPPPPHTLVDSGIDELSGPMSLVMTSVPPGNQSTTVNVGMRCQRCTTCSCDLKPSPRPKSSTNMEDLSEVETSSSGFSEGESRFCTKMTQTDSVKCCCGNDDSAQTPTPFGVDLLDLTSKINPCDIRFASQPGYRDLFHEIFEILKEERKDIEVEKVVRKTLKHCQQEVETLMNDSHSVETAEDVPTTNAADISTATTSSTTGSCSDLQLRDENEENKSPNVMTKEKKKEKKTENKERKPKMAEQKEESHIQEDVKEKAKPPRPDFLDLEASSRCSSRTRRRKRANRNRQNSGEQQNTQKQMPQTHHNSGEQQNTHKPTPQPHHNHHSRHSNQLPEQQPGQVQQETANSNITPDCTPNPSAGNAPTAPPAACTKVLQSKDTAKQPESRSASSSSKGRCEHKSRKNRHYKQKLQNKHLINVLTQHPPFQIPRQQNNTWSANHSGAASSANSALVQVARLIKFEKSYAEVLKSKAPSRDLRLT